MGLHQNPWSSVAWNGKQAYMAWRGRNKPKKQAQNHANPACGRPVFSRTIWPRVRVPGGSIMSRNRGTPFVSSSKIVRSLRWHGGFARSHVRHPGIAVGGRRLATRWSLIESGFSRGIPKRNQKGCSVSFEIFGQRIFRKTRQGENQTR
jgi:hypothetical protein